MYFRVFQQLRRFHGKQRIIAGYSIEYLRVIVATGYCCFSVNNSKIAESASAGGLCTLFSAVYGYFAVSKSARVYGFCAE